MLAEQARYISTILHYLRSAGWQITRLFILRKTSLLRIMSKLSDKVGPLIDNAGKTMDVHKSIVWKATNSPTDVTQAHGIMDVMQLHFNLRAKWSPSV